MIADWVAVETRARGLRRRRLGRDAARRLAGTGVLAAAIEALADSSYGYAVRSHMSLAEARFAVLETLLWHLRILAGWSRPAGAERIRRLAAGFEVANIARGWAQLEGRPLGRAFTLGALTVAWRDLAAARSIADLRARLAVSAWNEASAADLGALRFALEATWIERVADGVPEATGWARERAGMLIARAAAAGVAPPAVPALNALRALVGAHAYAQAVETAQPGDLWLADVAWWKRVERDAAAMCTQTRSGARVVVGSVALLAADARRVCVALELAARGGDVETFDAIT